MATITKSDLIERLAELDAPGQVERDVEAAIAALGWQDKTIFNGSETVALGVKMGELAQAKLAASADPAQRAQAEAVGELLDAARQDYMPHLDPSR